MYKKLYRRFLEANVGRIHMTGHSHHYWPDVTRDATLQYWDDSARWVDDKWDHIYSEVVPSVQSSIAKSLSLGDPASIVFAPNTHELVYRLLSCFPWNQPVRILTTDSEFHSFARQTRRLREEGRVTVETVPVQPIATFQQRFSKAIHESTPDLVFLSHVFFNSGLVARDFNAIFSSVSDKNPVCVMDGYHGFMAVPTDLSRISDRVFYVAGGYKYAQAGEGACFMAVPKGTELRPSYTGWFAEISSLASARNEVEYAENGMRFAGSTFDPSGLYKMRAVFELFEMEGLSVPVIHDYVQRLQRLFLEPVLNDPKLAVFLEALINSDLSCQGHFLTFDFKNEERCKQVLDALKSRGILTDSRGSRLRFGFGLALDESDILRVTDMMRDL